MRAAFDHRGEHLQTSTDDGARAATASIDDCECLLVAVTARLRLAVAEAPMQLHHGRGKTLPAIVLECVEALGQLHGVLHEVRVDRPAAAVKAAACDRAAPPASP
jgi:hypothetical protein